MDYEWKCPECKTWNHEELWDRTRDEDTNVPYVVCPNCGESTKQQTVERREVRE